MVGMAEFMVRMADIPLLGGELKVGRCGIGGGTHPMQ
jgi:hypothetical protein